MKSSFAVTAAAVMGLFAASTAGAITSDHLQCFKIKDDAAKAAYVATLTPTDPTFAAAPGCKIKVPASLLCVDTVKSAVSPAPPGAPDGDPAQTYLCYKTKCPTSTAAWTADDQFGTHNVTVSKTSLLCAPVNTVATTTTTTLPPGCASASDCPGSDTQCQTRTCSAGACGFSFASNGTLLMGQTSGDCQNAVCDGAGGTDQVANPMDVFVDGNQCTFDQCSAGVPINPVVPDNSSCNQGGGAVCSGGTCVALCGDGIVGAGEGCDDGNNANNDGCSATCSEELGYDCVGQPSVCVTVCGDGIVAPGEGCDDLNNVSGDGCQFNCIVESGFQCSGSPSVCVPN